MFRSTRSLAGASRPDRPAGLSSSVETRPFSELLLEERRALTASDGVELTYWLTPAARESCGLLLLLHGAASNHTRWSEFVDRTRLTETWDVLRPDMRGNGESMTRRDLGLATWCRDIEEILVAEGRRRAVVVGHSLGAQIGIHLAHRRPARVVGLVVVDPVFRRALSGWQRVLSRNLWLVRGLAAAVLLLNRIGLRRREFTARDLRELDRETRRALEEAESFDEIARRYGALGPILRHMPTANYLRQLVTTVAPLPPLEAITAPVLVLLSAGITFADLQTNRAEAARFPDHEVVEIAANHWPLTETPDEVRREIERWIGERFEVPASDAAPTGVSDTVGDR
ncbi:MAG: alpha/beta hydrolase [Thermoanaerobaculia bacterium]|nr:alpha/beta hydrolase [Thermoanaerobaculia bacterium]